MSVNRDAGSFQEKLAAVVARVVGDAADHLLSIDQRVIKRWIALI